MQFGIFLIRFPNPDRATDRSERAGGPHQEPFVEFFDCTVAAGEFRYLLDQIANLIFCFLNQILIYSSRYQIRILTLCRSGC